MKISTISTLITLGFATLLASFAYMCTACIQPIDDRDINCINHAECPDGHFCDGDFMCQQGTICNQPTDCAPNEYCSWDTTCQQRV